MPGAALFRFRRHDPHLAAEPAGDPFQNLQAGRVNAVIVGDQNAGTGKFQGRLEHLASQAPILARPPAYGRSASGTVIDPSSFW